MFRVLFFFLVTFSGATFADEVKYVTMDPLTTGNLSFRDTWDKTRQFCYNDDSKQTYCLRIVDMKEVKLRDRGEWSADPDDQPFISSLTDQNRETALRYDKLYVRYLALDQTRSKFVVHVHFINKGSSERLSQTIFVTGDYVDAGSGRKVELRGMSFSSGLEALGAIIKAGVALGSKATESAIYEQIVKDNRGLLSIGESVVDSYFALPTSAPAPLGPKP